MEGLHIELDHPSLQLELELLELRIRAVLDQEGALVKYLGVILTEKRRVRTLNAQYRGGDYDTDVLSFPLGDEEEIDGEIYINLDYAHERCEEFGATFEEEVHRYAIHGLLHLLEYNDKNESGRQQMRCLENRYLAISV